MRDQNSILLTSSTFWSEICRFIVKFVFFQSLLLHLLFNFLAPRKQTILMQQQREDKNARACWINIHLLFAMFESIYNLLIVIP